MIDLPPVWMVLAAALMWALDRLLPLAAFDSLWSRWLGLAVIGAGLGLATWAALAFRRAGTTIVPRQRPSALITSGPFRYSRNPVYLADVLMLLGWALWLGSLLSLLPVPAFAALIDRRFIRDEEAVLREAYGPAFETYASTTRRWV